MCLTLSLTHTPWPYKQIKTAQELGLNATALANARFSQDIVADEMNQISKDEFIIGAASEEVLQIEKTPLEKL